jgi:hypothetical protein
MRTLILSAVLYLLGIAILLLFRPALMFKKDGTWKEFGTTSVEHSIFPFWLFCIIWAILSYMITMLVVGEYSTAAACAAVATTTLSPEKEDSSPEDLVEPLPIKTTNKRKNIIGKSMTGYHMLNENATEEAGGVPQYLYVGDTPLKKPGYYMLNKKRDDLSKPKYIYVGNERPTGDGEEE